VADGTVRLSGWGRNTWSECCIWDVPTTSRIAEAVAGAHRGELLARGLGRSYGDASLNVGGIVFAPFRPAAEPVLDTARETVTATAGTSIGQLLEFLLPQGYTLPVVPGTRHVTVGGAIAADIHGKNHHVDSSFGRWVTALTLVDGSGERRQLTPGSGAAAFWATVGGMGATGVITAATITVMPAETAWIRLTSSRLHHLADLLDRLSAASPATYQVAWLDASGRDGDYRSILDEGEHATAGDITTHQDDSRTVSWARTAPAPVIPTNPFRPSVVKVLNTAWWHKPVPSSPRAVPLARFFFPLDGVRAWNRMYGPRGLVQYQFVVPAQARQPVRDVLDLLRSSGSSPSLVVLKSTGPGTPGPLSFPMPGWTVAADLPDRGDSLRATLAKADAIVAAAGGRVYLAKDSTSTPAMIREMYPRLDDWRETASKLDPAGKFSSDLIRRLRLRP
jgi:decaprenylphospho-beta-D-ribofuranose 2-oxidase